MKGSLIRLLREERKTDFLFPPCPLVSNSESISIPLLCGLVWENRYSCSELPLSYIQLFTHFLFETMREKFLTDSYLSNSLLLTPMEGDTTWLR
jgi:hypothetical protein